MHNVVHAISMITSTHAVMLLPAYTARYLPDSITTRPAEGEAAHTRSRDRLPQGQQIPDPEAAAVPRVGRLTAACLPDTHQSGK